MKPAPGFQPHAPAIAERKALALQRIEASRIQLIQRIYPEPSQHQTAASNGTTPYSNWASLSPLMARVQRHGFFQATWRTARILGLRWWKRQAWHASVDLVASTLVHEARPIVRRHPWASLAAGAAVAVALPWATRSLQTQMKPWRNNLGNLLWQQLAQPQVQLALASALTAWINDISQGSASAPQTQTPATDPAATMDMVQRAAP